ncbi:sulfite exporter TauE/SafE family protein [Marinivivus vitaminiproducens]|uniref:sulfite exporter TauE/SafE family protein n=1 Tax=Marinivivus vitaminiproducens TaxID=3035935 RepID=UPI0027A20422|nr:sulfite exporter TauE/SafE family protein [Geminicoccaceae bacterium SCSIO 64248]
MIESVALLAILAAIFALAGLVKGVTGMGLPTVGVGLLSTVMPPVEAAALMVVPTILTNIWQMVAGPALGGLAWRLWPMMGGICLGTWLGSGLLAADADLATATLGVALLVYSGFGLANRKLPTPSREAERWLGPLAGVVNGVVTAATGVSVIPAAPYLQALGLDREALVQALGFSFTVSTFALAGSLLDSGAFGFGVASHSLLALAPAFAGVFAGQALRRAVRPETFKRIFFVGLLLLGAHLAVKTML